MSASLFPSMCFPLPDDGRANRPVGSIPSGSKPRVIKDSHELEDVQVGEVIAPLNDYCLQWDEV
jgi:hypothetical protein